MDCIRSIIHRANKNPYIYEQHAFWLWISSEQNIRSTLHRSSVSISALVLSAASVYPIWFLAILFLISKFPRSTKYCCKTENKKTQVKVYHHYHRNVCKMFIKMAGESFMTIKRIIWRREIMSETTSGDMMIFPYIFWNYM